MALLSVGQQDVALSEKVQKALGGPAVMRLTGAQVQDDRPSLGIDQGMALGGQAAAGTSHAAIVMIPLFAVAPCWWPRTQELSIITMSPS